MMMADLLKVVAPRMRTTPEAIRGPRRPHNISRARHIFCWLAANHLQRTTTQIGRFLHRDHSTANYAIAKIEREVQERLPYGLLALDLLDELRGRNE